MAITQDLEKIIEGDVQDSEEILTKYSQDASIFKIKPDAVVFPKTSKDICNLVNFCTSNPGYSLTARCAGTCMSGGAINDSLIVDMTKYFNNVIKIGDEVALTQPGVFYRDFEKETLKQGLILPCYTASRDINTVGGMVGNNSAGEKTLSYGQTLDYVKKLKVILSDGNEYLFYPTAKNELDKKISQKNFEGEIYSKIYKLVSENSEAIKKARPGVSKNSAGYNLWDVFNNDIFDLTKLITGSQGTLGIVTEIEFKLVKKTSHSNLVVIFLNDLKVLPEVISKVLEQKPESFESYDDYTLKFAVRFLPEVIKLIDPNNAFKLAFKFLPEIWMSLTGGLPKLVLLAEFTGNSEEEVMEKCIKANEGLKTLKLKTRITSSEEEAKKYWTIRRQSFSLLRHHAKHMRTAPFIDDIIVKPEFLPEFLPKLRQILDKYKNKMVYTIAGHIGNGNFHIIPLVDLSDPQTRELIPKLSEEVFSLVFEYKGSMSGEHNDGIVRGPFLEKMYGKEIFELFKQVKTIFDPKDIFNPHKKTDASMEFLMHNINTTNI